jgi:hypothetical protein
MFGHVVCILVGLAGVSPVVVENDVIARYCQPTNQMPNWPRFHVRDHFAASTGETKTQVVWNAQL